MKYSFPEFQTVKLAEILPHILWFFFSNLRQFWFIPCLYPRHYLTNGRVSLLSSFHFWWRHLAENLKDWSTVPVLAGELTFYGEFLPITYLLQFFTYHCLWNSFTFLWPWITVHLFLDIGMVAWNICCFIWLTSSAFNIKTNSASLLSHLIWAALNLLSLTYVNGLLSMNMVNLDPKT